MSGKKVLNVLGYILLTLVLLELGLRASGYLHLAYRDLQYNALDGNTTILVLGDSFTFGGNTSWPAQMEKILREKGHPYKVINKAIRGALSEEIIALAPEYVEEYQPEMVIVMMGIRDKEIPPIQKEERVTSSKTKKNFQIFEKSRVYKFISFSASKIDKKLGNILNLKQQIHSSPLSLSLSLSLSDELDIIETKEIKPIQKLLWKGKIYLKYEEYHKAEKEFLRVYGFDQQSNEAQFQLVLTYVRWGKMEKASHISHLPENKAKQIAAKKFNEGNSYFQRQEFGKSRESYQTAIIASPTKVKYYVNLAAVYLANASYAEAENVLKAGLQISAQDTQLLGNLGTCYFNQKKYDLAEKIYQQLLELEPNNPTYHLQLGNTYFSKKKYDEAIILFEKAISLDYKQHLAYFLLGEIDSSREQYAQAITNYKLALQINKNNPEYYLRLADAYKFSQKYESALETYKQVSPNSSFAAEVLIKQGLIQQKLGQEAKAELLFKQAIAANRNISAGYIYLGDLYLLQNKDIEAEKLYIKSVAVGPTNADAIFSLSRFYLMNGQPEKAESLFLTMKNHPEIISYVYQQLGDYYFKSNKSMEAQAFFSRITDNNFEFSTRKNYLLLHNLLKERVLVVVGYPLQDSEELERIFPEKDNILFIENKENFQTALEEKGYSTLFVDTDFEGFGHGTAEGNRLIAENVAQAIIDISG